MAIRYQQQVDAGGHDDYGNSQHRPVDNDPLRELARLIGQTDPNSNFATRESQPRVQQAYVEQQYAEQAYAEPAHAVAEPEHEQGGPSWMRTAQQTTRHQPPIGGRATPLPQTEYEQESLPLSQPPAFLRARHQREAAPQQEYYDQQPHDQAARYDDALYGQNPDNVQYQDQQQYPQDGYQDQYDQQQYDPNAYQQYADEAPEPKRKRGGMFTVAMVAALAVVGTASAFAYRSYMGSPRSGEPPVIKAEPGANKIVPQQSADANKINDRIGATNGPERVVAREEQPVDIARQQPRVVFPPLNQNNNPPSVGSVSTTAAIVAPPAPANGAVGEEPRRVRTTTIRPNETSATQTRPNTAPTAARAQLPAGNGPMAITPQPAGSAPVRTAAAPAATGSTGGYVVQISSQRSEADAQASYRAAQAKFPNVLGSRSAMIRRADLGDKGIYFRAMVGPFGGAEDASQLCNSLKSAGGACVVQRN